VLVLLRVNINPKEAPHGRSFIPTLPVASPRMEEER
jgi:hypothetical protein